jgi:NTE family protein
MSPAESPATQTEEHRADGVFEGGGVKGIAFAGALAAAEEVLGIREWVNVAGTSAGAIAAALVAAGYSPGELREVLSKTRYREFADYGPGGRWISGPLNALTHRGLAHGDHFREWLGDRLDKAPEGHREMKFRDLARKDLPDGLSDAERKAARYRLRVIASDITGARMLVLPDDISDYCDEDGNPRDPDELSVVDGVRMSMSFPFFFEPVTLHRRDGEGNVRPHLIVDGGLLSNFPVWLFDSPEPVRPTWGFRLHAGTTKEEPPYNEVSRPLWELPMAKALFVTAMEAWDVRMSARSFARTVSIPTGEIKTLDFDLTEAKGNYLWEQGHRAATEAFKTRGKDPTAGMPPAAGPGRPLAE